MRVVLPIALLCALLTGCAHNTQDMRARYAGVDNETLPYRGWSYAASKLIEAGAPAAEVQAIFSDPRLPSFTQVPFGLAPKETQQMYSGFTSDRSIQRGVECIENNAAAFEAAERRYHVDRHIVASILLIESGCGRIAGKEQIFYRLARLVSTADPENVKWNTAEKKKVTPNATVDDYAKRARYLEQTFLPELLALLELNRRGTDVLELKGSSAGAFGIPQFLPSSYLRLGVDGDKDGNISLYSMPDAIFSAANFMKEAGWKDHAPVAERRAALWGYNRSSAYGDTILKVAILMRESDRKLRRGTAAM